MSDARSRQSTDAVNARGFGTNKLSEDQGNFLKANRLQDGGASGKGRKLPAKKTGVR